MSDSVFEAGSEVRVKGQDHAPSMTVVALHDDVAVCTWWDTMRCEWAEKHFAVGLLRPAAR